MLYNFCIKTIQRSSQGARGLSVQPQKVRICTDNSISLNICWRQWGSRYTIHARRNLPDKEFRYLRTVRVTAAVYWGLKSMLAHVLFTFQHRAGIRPYTSFFNFAESCVFNKQSPPPLQCHLSKNINFQRAPLLPKLQSVFAEFLQHTSFKRLSLFNLSTCVGLSTVFIYLYIS